MGPDAHIRLRLRASRRQADNPPDTAPLTVPPTPGPIPPGIPCADARPGTRISNAAIRQYMGKHLGFPLQPLRRLAGS